MSNTAVVPAQATAVVPAKAGTQGSTQAHLWIPAFAGMTV